MGPTIVVADRYELGDLLGSGGVAQVFRAHDQLLGRDVAVKLFGPGFDATGPARVRTELQILARLSHPNLVVVHDAGTDTEHSPPRPFLVMQLIDGPSLEDLLKAGPLQEGQVRDIGVHAAKALAYVHDRGVVHRDIKPGNILLDRSARAYVADFGIAQVLGQSDLTAPGLTVGTAAFLSPEQVRGSAVGPASDVFALGLVLLEALTGQREYLGTTVEVALARLTRPPIVSGRVPAAWRVLLAAMTAADPADRPAAVEVAGLLEALEASVTDQGQSSTRVLRREDETAVLHDLADNTSAAPAGEALGTAAGPADTRVLPSRTATVEAPTTFHTDSRGARRDRRPASALVIGTAVAVAVLAASAVALSSGSGRSGNAVPPAPAGTPGPARLSPDLTRLSQLVKP